LALRCGGGGPAERIEGRVRDPHGRPLANALVQARDGGGTVASARSDAAGEFRLFRGHGRSTSVRLIATSLAGDGATAPTAPVDWGTRDLVLELAPAPGILLRVTDAATGAPLERYSVQCVATTGMRSSAEGRRRADGQHPDGRCLLAVSRPGPNVLIVWPEDPRWLPSLPRSFDRDGCGGRLEVTLARAEACPVAVVDPAGRPLAGVDVELVLPAPAAEIVRDLDRLLVDGGVRVPVDLRVARARTDADGRARLCWRTGAVPCELRLSGGGIAPHVEPGVQLSTAGVTVRVGATAVLAVRIAGGGPVRVALREVDGARRVPEAWAAPLVVTGAAEFAVPPGQWQVFAARPVTIDGRSCREWIELPEPVATVALAAGRTAELELDLAAALAPSCVVRGVALVDGQPASHLVLLCGEVGPDGRVRPRRLIEGRADGRGWFAFEGLRPGAYSLQLRLRCSGRTIAVPLAGGEWHVLATGEQWMPATVDLATAAVRIRVPGASSAAGSGRLVELYSAARIALVGELDAGDDVAFDRVPVGSYRVRLRDVTGDVSPVELGRLEVAGAGPVAVELPIAPR
ncbi:MAG: carboxypeptidase regulatory-like domain-containing protein, partial [Planctomycetes bacterium]|nr:carboxypeptidase regulatory-like domain-containing protein [Planctomycetota bacterium]